MVFGAAHAAAPMLCGTAQHADDFLSHRPRRPPPPVADLIDHETHGPIANVQYSEHFALKWGPDVALTSEHASAVLGHFEDILVAEVDGWEMASPTDGFRYFNVYVGDTGGSIPSAGGMAGYYTTDGDGFPMIVLANDTISDLPYARSVIAHEFFHAVQWASESFWVWETGSWFWEATATWAAGEIVPEHDTYWNALPFAIADSKIHRRPTVPLLCSTAVELGCLGEITSHAVPPRVVAARKVELRIGISSVGTFA